MFEIVKNFVVCNVKYLVVLGVMVSIYCVAKVKAHDIRHTRY